MKLLCFLAFLLGIAINSSSSWGGAWRKLYGHVHVHHDIAHHEDCMHDAHPEEYRPSSEHLCSCTFYVGDQEVYRRDDSNRYACNGWGLSHCVQFCDGLFYDETNRHRAYQNACDVIGREIFTGWYRRTQVCGIYGPHEDILLANDLCCRRGRPSDECTQEQMK